MKGNTGSHNKREGRMSVRGGWRGRVGLVGLMLVAVAALAVSGSAFGKGAAPSCGTVAINEQSWSGSTANTYVAKYVLEKRLGCKVKLTQVTEGPPYFQAMRDGKVDVALEDWDNTATKQAQPYLKDGSVRIVGSNGITGRDRLVHPALPAQAVPGVQDVEGAEGQGVRVQVARVGLAGHVPRRGSVLRPEGSRPHQGARPQPQARRRGRRARAGRTLEPAVQAEEAGSLLLVRPAVPERAVRPRADPAAEALRRAAWTTRSSPASTRASTRPTASTSSSRRSSRRAARRPSSSSGKWKWTSKDQNFVANLISGKKMKPEKAAEQWVKANPGKVNAWLK